MASSNKNLNIFFTKNKFLGSFESEDKIPLLKAQIECCFIGRSNVGKSSLINALTRTKKLAKTSKTPGRTQAINIFEINNKINLVDLPGYGFAKASKVTRENLMILIEKYIENRNTLNHVFLLIDSKIGIKNSDIDMLDLLSDFSREFSIILTKIDKISINYLEYQKKSIFSLMQNYKKSFVKIYQSETKKNNGITEIQRSIYGISK
ncbi:ribosome biogenesis GTP-binding protein YihA/YsxC [Pelagibacteraceae bacterium]|nr:ribosome biogenesis GTP-binding protein YihA/YsxC [Pelagibacteraceae bacterium]